MPEVLTGGAARPEEGHGAHRLRAALPRGEEYVEAWFVEGTGEDAFVPAVRLNSQHGLPLSQADRTAAAERFLSTRSQGSDRRIAGSTGVSPATVAALRGRSSVSEAQSNARAGCDGRVRPLNAAEGRRRAVRFLAG
ncbi:hypothetical protein [Streptomyces roseochromogenus]|uniref:Uncharacterized protein n=1 Tax=Streptomyces roseochromogenus subsp. oscitans DS 12.976 TaxID=1352936 RepID=V6KSW1_STRRC|nr:hypothetical protein [Streptomyces roseochromogenus]EST32069.1 hypothetical protein M878_15645 [Streptomyces roseochromogenus subsp. oscitans DS 12.976]